jgi:hypothetical protein
MLALANLRLSVADACNGIRYFLSLSASIAATIGRRSGKSFTAVDQTSSISTPKYSCTKWFRIAITLFHGISGCATRSAGLIERAASPTI